MINTSKSKNKVETKINNTFIILVIFENDIINIQTKSIIYIAKVLVFNNYNLSIKKCYSNMYHKVNNLKLTLFKIILIFL